MTIHIWLNSYRWLLQIHQSQTDSTSGMRTEREAIEEMTGKNVLHGTGYHNQAKVNIFIMIYALVLLVLRLN